MTHPCHPQPKAKRFGLGIHIPFCHPALDAGSRQKDWIPVFTGMTKRRYGNDRGKMLHKS